MPYPEAIAHYPQGLQVFVKRLSNRIDNNLNAVCVVVGKTGSGKSYATESIAIALYLYRNGKMPTPEYIQKHTVFKALEFMQNLNSPELKRGEFWTWDEAGIDVGHKDHSSVKNRILGWLVQTFRNQGQIVFLTVPTVSFIDASIRKLFHFYIEAKLIDKKSKTCFLKVLEYQYNPRHDKVFYHLLRSQDEDGVHVTDFIGCPIPPKEFISAYEEKKTLFTQDLNQKIQNNLIKMEQKEIGMIENKSQESSRLDYNINLPEVLPKRERILDLIRQGITSTKEISEKLNIKYKTVASHKMDIMREIKNAQKTNNFQSTALTGAGSAILTPKLHNGDLTSAARKEQPVQ